MRNSQPLIHAQRLSSERITSELLNRLSYTRGPLALRVSIGVVLLWFGALKEVFPECESCRTIALTVLTLGLVPARTLVVGLASFEIAPPTTLGAMTTTSPPVRTVISVRVH